MSAILPNALTAVLTDSSPDADGFVSLGFRALDFGDFALNRLLSMFAFVVVVGEAKRSVPGYRLGDSATCLTVLTTARMSGHGISRMSLKDTGRHSRCSIVEHRSLRSISSKDVVVMSIKQLDSECVFSSCTS